MDYLIAVCADIYDRNFWTAFISFVLYMVVCLIALYVLDKFK